MPGGGRGEQHTRSSERTTAGSAKKRRGVVDFVNEMYTHAGHARRRFLPGRSLVLFYTTRVLRRIKQTRFIAARRSCSAAVYRRRRGKRRRVVAFTRLIVPSFSTAKRSVNRRHETVRRPSIRSLFRTGRYRGSSPPNNSNCWRNDRRVSWTVYRDG